MCVCAYSGAWMNDCACLVCALVRVQWCLRALLILVLLVWTAMVASRLSEVSPLGFMAGLCLVSVCLLGIDCYDVVNYSDEVPMGTDQPT